MSAINPVRRIWHRWKSLRLPWRRKWLCGSDLSGTTFWEMRHDVMGRTRRIARPPINVQHSDLRISPAWHQWLRHTRPTAPSIQEQLLDVQRQESLKQLAAAADQRWAEKPSYIDAPQETAQTLPEMQPRDKGGYANSAVEGGGATRMKNAVRSDEEAITAVDQGESKAKRQDNPWGRSKGGPSEEWKPEAWSPQSAERR